MNNPYETPQSPGPPSQNSDKSDTSSRDLASGQKLLIYAILAYFGVVALATVVGEVAMLAALGCLVMAWTGIYKVSRGLGMSLAMRVVLLACMLLPLLNLLVLLALNSSATSKLKAAGYRVGFLGVRNT